MFSLENNLQLNESAFSGEIRNEKRWKNRVSELLDFKLLSGGRHTPNPHFASSISKLWLQPCCIGHDKTWIRDRDLRRILDASNRDSVPLYAYKVMCRTKPFDHEAVFFSLLCSHFSALASLGSHFFSDSFCEVFWQISGQPLIRVCMRKPLSRQLYVKF